MGFLCVVYLVFFLYWDTVNGDPVNETTTNLKPEYGLIFQPDDVNFFVATTETTGRPLKHTQFNDLENLGVNLNYKTIFVVHGYLSGQAFIDDFQKAYSDGLTRPNSSKTRDPINFIGVDWSAGSDNLYSIVIKLNVPKVVEALTTFLKGATENNKYLNLDNCHIVGHSLGAHIAGLTGKNFIKQGLKLPHITALDPAGWYIDNWTCKRKLCSTDADYIEVLHTSSFFGTYDPFGVYDYYINGGDQQPDCSNPVCSHSYAHEWYREIIVSPDRIFKGWLCPDMKMMNKKKYCVDPRNPRNYTFSDLSSSQSVSSIVYVPTNKKPNENSNDALISSVSENSNEEQTIIFFGTDPYYSRTLAELLSDDGQLRIHINEDSKISLFDDGNENWVPNRKYIVCTGKTVQEYTACLEHQKAPFRHSLVFDTINAYEPEFWDILKFVASDVVSQPRNNLNLIVFGIPLDDVPIETHFEDIKYRFDSELLEAFPTLNYNVSGLHEITTPGLISSQTLLVGELKGIRNIVEPVGTQ